MVVVGGGIIGLVAARELAGRGLAVTVLERGEPGQQASAAAAGMLAPLAELPEPGPMFEAARAARDQWGGFAAEVADEAAAVSPDLGSLDNLGYDTSGALSVAADEESGEALTALASAAEALGETTREMPLEELRHLVPDLSPTVHRALHLPGDHRVDNVVFCRALASAARTRGVIVESHSEVTSLEEVHGGVRLQVASQAGDAGSHRTGTRAEARAGAVRTLEAGAVLLAAGAWSGRLLAGSDRQSATSVEGFAKVQRILPVVPVRGQMMSLGDIHWPWTGSVRAGDRYAVRRSSLVNAVRRADTVLVGATVEDAGFSAINTAAGLADLTAFVTRLFPGLAQRPVRSVWAGLRPGTADGLPFIGALPGRRHTWVATGHYKNGILLAPWTARRIADRITGEENPPPKDPFALEGRLSEAL